VVELHNTYLQLTIDPMLRGRFPYKLLTFDSCRKNAFYIGSKIDVDTGDIEKSWTFYVCSITDIVCAYTTLVDKEITNVKNQSI